ncbi:hypothetical protein CY34DRAFT_109577 [Suillus luteus UH-Slu-Lm8-n1]|uniref:Uncharacterized protein n=1 Tax=Suillus luteus UH-Slu-Lm8-n1 TaxID=930992 RepID=A0A0C9ZFS8_9AGAM|nr:hypothetical protein CY34DRAFT_109577 [Suillus luteus UH-Slu-Lm8-n1]
MFDLSNFTRSPVTTRHNAVTTISILLNLLEKAQDRDSKKLILKFILEDLRLSERHLQEEVQWVRSQIEVLENPQPERGMYSEGSRGPRTTESLSEVESRHERLLLRGTPSFSDFRQPQHQCDVYSESSRGPRLTESLTQGAGNVSPGQVPGNNEKG